VSRALGIDPGWRNLATVIIDWAPRGSRNVLYHRTIKTTNKMSDRVAWALLHEGLREIFESEASPDTVACEEMCGVRHGHNGRGTSSGSTDELLEVQGAIRSLAYNHGKRLVLVRSLSSYGAMGTLLSGKPGESRAQKSKRQKAANMAAARLWFGGAEELDEHESDACLHAGAVMLGKGVEA
jgi:hypothetical protein